MHNVCFKGTTCMSYSTYCMNFSIVNTPNNIRDTQTCFVSVVWYHNLRHVISVYLVSERIMLIFRDEPSCTVKLLL